MNRTTDGWGSGLLGVIIFSGSLPATRVAVGDFSPLFLTSARAVIAAVLGAALLCSAPAGEASPQRSWFACRRRTGCRGRLPATDGACAPAHHVSALHCLHRPSATGHRYLRRPSRRRAAEVNVLALLRPRECNGSGLCPVQQQRRFAHGRSAHAGRHRAVRPGLRRRRPAVTQAGRLAGHFMGSASGASDDGGSCADHAAAILDGHRRSGLARRWPMCRFSACWLASCSGIAASRSGALRALGSCNCCSPSSGWRWRGLLLHEPVPGR